MTDKGENKNGQGLDITGIMYIYAETSEKARKQEENVSVYYH